jgi:hypothetical protein
LERLENRELLAGNIQATLIDGDLQLTGDDRGNGVRIYEVAPGTGHFRLEGLPQGGAPTRINGQPSIEFRRVAGDLSILLAGGDDLVQLGQTEHATVNANRTTIDAGLGDDAVELVASQLGALNIGTDLGDDTVRLSDVSLRYGADIGVGAGDDTMELNRVSVGYGLDIATGQGADQIALAHIQAGYDLNVRGGDGDDRISIRDSRAGEDVNIYGMDGRDSVTLDAVAADILFASLGEENDSLSISRCQARLGSFSGNRGHDRLVLGVDNDFRFTQIEGFES